MELLEKYVVLFFIYSFCGWSIEVIGEIVKTKKFVNRGFFMGPYCPIYGVGAVIITSVLGRYNTDFADSFAVFGMSMIMCGTLEYFTSWIMELIFKARWWDYSNYKFNINGRICLETMFLFGIAGVLIINVFNKFVLKLFDLIPSDIRLQATIVPLVIFTIDVIFSFNIMAKIKDISMSYRKEIKDNTDEITEKIRATIMEKSLPYRRIIRAFPQAFANKIKESAEKVKDNINEVKQKTVENIEEAKEKAYALRCSAEKNVRYTRLQAKRNYNSIKRSVAKRIYKK